MAGSIEIIRLGESFGVGGRALTSANVPTVVAALYGITGMSAVTPTARPTGRTPSHQWAAKDASGMDVVVCLWPGA